MKNPAHKIKHIAHKTIHSVKSLRHTDHKSNFKNWKMRMKYRLFVFDRKWQLHPVFKRVYPKPGIQRRMAISMLAFVIAGAGFLVYMHATAQADWYDNTWAYRKTITVDHTKVPATQTSFPIVVNITDTSLAANAQASGGDILFTSANGTTKLSHEIESYDASTGKLIAWVNVPTLSSTADTVIYMYYGNNTAASQQNATGVWDSTFAAVWHMQSASGTTQSDSTTNGNTATRQAAGSPAPYTSGIIGGGQDFDGTDDYFSVNDANSLDMTTMTLSAWVNLDNNNAGEAQIMDKRSGAGGFNMRTGGNGTFPEDLAFVAQGSGGVESYQSVTDVLAQSTWTYVTVTYNSSTNAYRIYKDGVLRASGTSTQTIVANATNLRIGDIAAGVPSAFNLDGKMDETRIANSVRTDEWITTEYNNQSSPSTFFSVGSQQQKKNPALYWKFDEGQGTTAYDASGANNHGTISGATWASRETCLFEGSCLKFDGADDYVRRLHDGSADAWCNDTNGLRGCTASWSARMKIVFSGNTSTTNLPNFPVLVKLDSTRIDYSKTQAGGADIRFVDASNPNTVLPHEIESWNSSGTSYVWVKVPQIDANSRSDYIWMYYGNSAPPYAQQPTSVWDGSYGTVQHFDETAACNTTFTDSTSNLQHASCNGSGPTANASGKIGPARTYDGASQYATITDNAIFDPGAGSITVEAWINPTNINNVYSIFSHTDAAFAGWNFYISDAFGTCTTGYICFYDGTTSVGVPMGQTSGNWIHVAVVKVGTTATFYVNGNNFGSGTVAGTLPGTADPVRIGRGGTSTYFAGAIDEARYSNTNRSGDWIKATYLTQSDQFNTYAPDGSDSRMDPGTSSFSIGAWFRHSNTISGTDTIVARADSVNGIGYKMYYNSTDGLCFGIDDSAGGFPSDDACSNTSYADNKWHYVEAVKSGTSFIKLYVDGREADVDGIIASGSLSGVVPPFYSGIDADGSSNPWDGYLDEVRYYNYARSADEVKADYTSKGSVLGASSTLGAESANNSLYNGLVGYWKLDDGVNVPCSAGVNKVCDSSGNGTVGTWTNGTASTSGRFGNAAKFDGTNDYISFGNPSSTFQNPTTAITISTWVNIGTNKDWNNIVVRDSWTNPGSVSWIMYSNASGFGTFGVSDTSGAQYTATTPALSTNTWYHLVGTYDGTYVRMYLNGVLQSTTAKSGLTFSAITGLNISDSSSTMNGKVDDVRIYNRALSPSEITTLYDWAPGPVGYWKMDERTGQSVYDSSGNGNNMTVGTSSSVDLSDAEFATGKVGGATKFSTVGGVERRLTRVDSSSLDITGGITLSGWVNPTVYNVGGNYDTIVDKESQSNYGLQLQATTHYLTFFFWNGVGYTEVNGTTAVPLNQWSYVSATFDDTTGEARLYVNGVLDSTTTGITGDLNTNNNDLQIGYFSGESWNGYIDDLKIYNYVRTAKQVVSDMNSGHPAVGSPVGSAIVHLKFDNSNGNVSSNSGSCGTICNARLYNISTPPTNTSGWTKNGKHLGALKFDGINDYVDTPASVNVDITGSSFTLSSWVNAQTFPTAGTWKTFIEHGGGGYYLELEGPSEFNCGFTGNDFGSNAANLKTNTWYYLSCVFDDTSNTVKLYVNGKLNRTYTTASTTSATGEPLNIGRAGWDGQYFNGMLDEVKVYNYPLNENEIKVDMNMGKGTVFGALSTNPDGYTASNSAARSYCPPGDTSSNCVGTGGTNPAPVGEWNFEEGRGTNTSDSSGNNFTASLTGLPRWVSGKTGKALYFRTVGQYGSVGATTALNNLPTLTAEAWVYPQASNLSDFSDRHIVSKADSSVQNAGWGMYYMGASQNVGFYAAFSSGGVFLESEAGKFQMNKWNHVTATWDGTFNTSGIHIYINGVESGVENSGAGAGTYVSDAAFKLTIGNVSALDATAFEGAIDQVRIYNYVRTQPQIAWDYNKGKPTSWWKFDECTGSTIHDVAFTGSNVASAIDGTFNGNGTSAGTCNGSAGEAWFDGKVGKFNSSMDFDGADDVVSVANTTAIDLNEGFKYGLTWSTWVKANSDGEGDLGQIFNKGTNTFCRTSGQVSNHLNLQCSLDLATTDATITIGNAFDTGGWHNVVMSWSDDADDEITIWIDGKFRGTSNNGSGAAAADTSSLFLGGNGVTAANTAAYDGLIDQVMLFPYEMNATNIRTLYNENSAVRFGPQTGSPN